MKTQILVLDSDQGVGTANRFVINLNDSIRGCVHAQLRQVILTDMAPSGDYVYVRSGKLGSTVISAQGFGAFDVVPVSVPFRYERYSAVPPRNEFECGRLLNNIDISLVNPDNTFVALTPSVMITNPSIFTLQYSTNYVDGTSQGDSLPVYIPVGLYSIDELVAAIDKALPDNPLPHIQFSTSFLDVLNLTMDWETPSSVDTILVNTPLLLNGIGINAVYDIETVSSPVFPVSLSTGTYTKEEFVFALQNALTPTAEVIANMSSSAAFTVSLSPQNNIVVNLNWTCLSKKNQVLVQQGTLFSGVGVVATFQNLPTLSSPMSAVSIPTGAYTPDQLVDAIMNALSLSALGITETFQHGEFFVSITPEDDLLIQLNWVCSSYGNLVSLPTMFVIDDITVQASFSDGTTQTTSTTPALHIPAGSYDTDGLENAITNSLAPIATAMVASNNYNSAVFTTDITDNVVSVNLDWVCSSYSDLVAVNATTFTVRMVVENSNTYHDVSAGFYVSQQSTSASNSGTFDTRITIPSGNYSQGEIFDLISTTLLAAANNNNGNAGQNNHYSVDLVDGVITISAGGQVSRAQDTTVYGVGGDIQAGYYRLVQNCVVSILFDAGSVAADFTLLGLNITTPNPYVSITPPQTSTALVFAPSVSFTLCPSFPPTLTGIVGTMAFSDGDYTLLGLVPASTSTVAGLQTFATTALLSANTSFNSSTLQQRSTWTFSSPVRFPVLTSVVPTLNVHAGNGWVASAPVIIQATTEQYSFSWSIPLTFPTLTSASALLTYDGASAMNSVLGLASGSGVQSMTATAMQFATGVEQFTWTFPSPLSFPVLQNVSASIINSSSDIGGGAAAMNGVATVFNAKQRRFDWAFPNPPITTGRAKATVVVEITTV